MEEYCRDRRNGNDLRSLALVRIPLGRSLSSKAQLFFRLVNKKNRVIRIRIKINRRLNIDAK
jgi:hypothetical protein